MKKLHFKFYRFIFNEKYYPFNIWIYFFAVFFFSFLTLIVSGTFFWNFITNSNFYEGLKFSFVFSIITTFFIIIFTYNPFQLIKVLYDTCEKIADVFLIRVVKLFRK